LKIRIFALAKELGIDSKELIEACNNAGLSVKASPLASISPDERDLVLSHLRSADKPSSATAPEEPRREAVAERKVRQIKTLGPLGGSIRELRGRTAEAADEEEAVEEAPEAPGVADETQELQEVAAETEAGPTDDDGASGDEAPGDATASPEPEAPRVAPISKSDYVAPTGLSGVREMRPRGSVRDVDSKARRDRAKKSPTLPSVATPTFKGPAAAPKTEAPAQKPEMRLTAEFLKQSPLSGILKKHKEETKRPRDAEEEDDRPKRGSGMGLEGAREERRKRRQRTRVAEDDESRAFHKAGKRHRRSGPVDLKSSASVTVPITVRDFSEALGRPARDIIAILFRRGETIRITDTLDEEAALEVALELGVDLTIARPETIEDTLRARLEVPDEDTGVELLPRPPVITILGHVDHGKTTLIDRLRSSNVVAGEAGGITQHIAAYQVDHNGQKLTFVDTPGHAAFGEMRARGANVTDIVVLVVAADDGVMPQTVECISHAKAAGVPIVVAMNKIDLPGADEQKVLTGLSHHEVLPVEWGGDTEVVRISALKGTGVDDLLETLLLTAELSEFKAPAAMPAEGVCLEAFRDEGLGPVAWLVVRRGTLRVGDVVACGAAHGRVRAMYADNGEELASAPPSTPIKVAGFDVVPDAGDRFFVMADLESAREVALWHEEQGKLDRLSGLGGPRTLEEFFADRDGGVRVLPLILKADTPGSIEALRGELDKFEHPEVRLKILHDGVGGVNESDVTLAASSGAIIIAFHVVAEERARSLADHEGVEIRRYNIIYKMTDDIRQALEGLLRPEEIEIATGRAIVLQTFSISRLGTIAGCRVLNGTIERSDRVHVIRDQTVLNDYAIASLKREKEDVREVRDGLECGIRLEGFNDVKEGDLLESFRIEQRKRTLDEST